MANKAPGKHFRKGLSTRQFFQKFPDNEAAEQWFIEHRWPNGIACPECGSLNVKTATAHKTMPYRCREKVCGKRFSTKTGTFMECSKLSFLDWLFAVYLVSTSLKSVSSMKLRRDLGVTQKTAWHMAHRIRKAMGGGTHPAFGGPVEVDETFVGGLERNKHSKDRARAGRGAVGKAAVVGVKDRATNEVRAQVVEDTEGETLRGFVHEHTDPDATVYTDGEQAYASLPNHEAVRHSVGEYVRGQAHTNGIESFWSMLKRAHKGTFHKLSAKHLGRYVGEFAERHNMRSLDTLAQMAWIVRRMERAQLRYRDLVA